ncbi:MbtH protein [Frankia sp. AiPs1]|nr:MbtH family NRPS accessory protein [Frankia sp. AiPa1]MCL9758106.1 MbtH family NRPS accessory protein [Frankia sp. AiPa1]
MDEFRVVVNQEEQYSIWAADRPVPAGWRAEGTVGDRETCLARIEQVWTDMRPLSLRQFAVSAGTAVSGGAGPNTSRR